MPIRPALAIASSAPCAVAVFRKDFDFSLGLQHLLLFFGFGFAPGFGEGVVGRRGVNALGAVEQAFESCGRLGFVLGPLQTIRPVGPAWPWANIEACERAWRRLR